MSVFRIVRRRHSVAYVCVCMSDEEQQLVPLHSQRRVEQHMARLSICV